MAFVPLSTPFTGAAVRGHASRSSVTPLRCAMGDSLAPVITIKDTKSDQTSSVAVGMAAIAPDQAAAAGIPGPAALKATLKGRRMPTALPAAPEACPPGTAPPDFYFPRSSRNTAPVITLGADQSLAVSYDVINTTVAGISSNAPDSVAFWKEKTYKWAAPADAPAAAPASEVIETALFEKYFPTVVRNRAPVIKMRPPAGPWDDTAYLILDSEFVSMNEDLARKLSVKAEDGAPRIQAAVTVEKYFGSEKASKAPIISVVPNESVSFGFEVVASPLDKAKAFLAEKGVTSEE